MKCCLYCTYSTSFVSKITVVGCAPTSYNMYYICMTDLSLLRFMRLQETPHNFLRLAKSSLFPNAVDTEQGDSGCPEACSKVE
jgi:hypothetical protein